jgi:hypothetical protein
MFYGSHGVDEKVSGGSMAVGSQDNRQEVRFYLLPEKEPLLRGLELIFLIYF